MGERLAVGVDVGGTRIKSAVVDLDSGHVRAEAVVGTDTSSRAAFIQQLREQVVSLGRSAGVDVLGVGVGLPGCVRGNEVSALWPSLQFLEGIDARHILEEALALPTWLENDARVAALGEAHFGHHGSSRLLSLTLGTGLGVAMAIDGDLQERDSSTHLAGHIPVRTGARTCDFCGISGCLEALVSAQALGADPSVSLRDPRSPTSERWMDDLGAGINAYVNVYAPDTIVIGGGISRSITHEHLASIQARIISLPFRGYSLTLRTSRLAERAGTLGAAALVQHPTVRDFARNQL